MCFHYGKNRVAVNLFLAVRRMHDKAVVAVQLEKNARQRITKTHGA
jgi:hypothetical protein